MVIAEHMLHCVGLTVAVAEYEPKISSGIILVMFPCENAKLSSVARSNQSVTDVICLFLQILRAPIAFSLLAAYIHSKTLANNGPEQCAHGSGNLIRVNYPVKTKQTHKHGEQRIK